MAGKCRDMLYTLTDIFRIKKTLNYDATRVYVRRIYHWIQWNTYYEGGRAICDTVFLSILKLLKTHHFSTIKSNLTLQKSRNSFTLLPYLLKKQVFLLFWHETFHTNILVYMNHKKKREGGIVQTAFKNQYKNTKMFWRILCNGASFVQSRSTYYKYKIQYFKYF
jgi:hypothetical protein